MSFILDALKKSEAERQRQSGPTLLELRITQPPRRYPAWALWVGVLLALNAAVLLYALLRRPAVPEPAMAATAAAPAAVRNVPPPPAAAPVAANPVAPPSAALASPGSATATAGTPPGAAAAGTPASNVTTVAPLAPPQMTAGSAASASASAPAPATTSGNPADDEPAVPASASPSRPVDYSTLPSSASLGGDVPALQLNLLDYSPLADERFALINMHRVREGDVLPEGPRVLAITREGVALDYHGQEFMLRSGGSGSPP